MSQNVQISSKVTDSSAFVVMFILFFVKGLFFYHWSFVYPQECTFRRVKFSCGHQDGSDDVTVGFSVNDSMILCFNELGCGQAAMNKLSAIMNIPGMANRTYSRLSRKVGEARQMVTANVLSAAVTAVRSANLVNAEEADRDDDNAQ